MKKLLSGNEAIARGAYEAGVKIAAAYPGTPSTEILENISKYKEINSEWSVNEKVAFEVAFGGALAGSRALAAMKHVGVNVASDALMTAAYTGVNSGFVLVTADDPGMHSSQNEQDNRYFAKMAKIPMLEPSDSQEAKDFTRLALEISEQYDTPVLLRVTTRICHGKGVVDIDERKESESYKYEKNPQKYVMIPAYARKRKIVIEKRLQYLAEFSESVAINRIEISDPDVGFITSGISHQYTKEVFPNASYFKLGMTYPLPMQAIKKFVDSVKTVYVIEELEPFIEEQLLAAGIKVLGKSVLPNDGELSAEILREKILNKPVEISVPVTNDLPARPPVMCAGCPHRKVFHVLKKLKATISGDIGCYTLSSLPPLETMDTCICMGGSIGVAQGLSKVLQKESNKPIVGVLGDSTFFHSGIPSLVNAVYNKTNVTIIILDNRITAMTGHQDNPGTGKTLSGEETKKIDFKALALACGVEHVAMINLEEMSEITNVIKEAVSFPGPSVVIAQSPCVLIDKKSKRGYNKVDPSKCTMCKVCLRIGCPAISMGNESVVIDPLMCTMCNACLQICPSDAISPA